MKRRSIRQPVCQNGHSSQLSVIVQNNELKIRHVKLSSYIKSPKWPCVSRRTVDGERLSEGNRTQFKLKWVIDLVRKQITREVTCSSQYLTLRYHVDKWKFQPGAAVQTDDRSYLPSEGGQDFKSMQGQYALWATFTIQSNYRITLIKKPSIYKQNFCL